MPGSQNVMVKMPITALRGIGPERASQLSRLELHTVEDLLLHRPRRYEDRRHFRSVAELRLGEPATTRGTIVALGIKSFRHGSKSLFEFILEDGTARLHCRWWNLPYMRNYFEKGDEVLVYGALDSMKPRTIEHPETEVIVSGEESMIHLNRIVPIYPLTEGLPQRWLRALVWRTLSDSQSQIVPPHAIPPGVGLPDRAEALRMLHFPEEMDQTERARQRLALDEFLALQLNIQERRQRLFAIARGLRCVGDNRFVKPFLDQLGFKLTGAQSRVLGEIRRDLTSGAPMRRLLQGDVGSGKTAVAAVSALMSLESGYSVALMAPTEILAQQHFQNFSGWCRPLGIDVQLHTGSHKSAKVQAARSKTQGQVDLPLPSVSSQPSAIIIGTHALIESGATVPNLGLVIIDEQHKFGVVQREKLVRKGNYPHLLVMTATPIPRTLGLTLYGDLDTSVIDELPPGRGQIRTFIRTSDKLPKVWNFIRQKLDEGRQAYVVYPRVDDSGLGDLKTVTKDFARCERDLAPHRVALVHGRLALEERERVMASFRRGEVKALLATSVIEVGVDVPNATIMLVENAERFGLAQLHQLRGRIGRGAHESYCILIADERTEKATERLQVLAESTDGFQIAEADLKLRGVGDLLGQDQSGLPRFRFGDLVTDGQLIEKARELAVAFLRQKRKF